MGIQFLIAIHALGLLGAEHTDLRRKCPYSGSHRIICNRAQHNVVTAIFGEDRLSTPALAHSRGN